MRLAGYNRNILRLKYIKQFMIKAFSGGNGTNQVQIKKLKR